MGGIDRQDLADHHPVEKHPQGSKPLLHRRFGMQLQLRLNKRRHMNRLDLSEIHNAVFVAEPGELSDRLSIGPASVGGCECAS